MTTDDADTGGPSGLEDPPPGPLEAAGPELDAYGLPPATSRTYLFATACLIGAVVSVGLAVTEWAAAYTTNQDQAGWRTILGMAIGLLAGIGGLAGGGEHPGGVNLIYKGTAWLGTIGFVALMGSYGAADGWSP